MGREEVLGNETKIDVRERKQTQKRTQNNMS